jgi:hypothetical protein
MMVVGSKSRGCEKFKKWYDFEYFVTTLSSEDVDTRSTRQNRARIELHNCGGQTASLVMI